MKPDPAANPVSPRTRFFRWIILWMVLYAASLLAYNVSYGFTRDVLIYHAQVRPAAWALQATLPGTRITHDEARLAAPGLILEIRRGCDGMEVWLLLVSALIAFPMPWRRRGRSIFYGTLLVFSLNLLRIVTMFHLTLRHPQWFDLAHGLIWQSIMVLSVIVFVIHCLNQSPRPPPAGPDAGS